MTSHAKVAALAILTLFAQPFVDAQDCNCGVVLDKQYPTILKATSSSTFQQRVWEYFCSDSFEQQARNGKAWGEVTVPIEGVPVPFAGGAQYGDSWAKRSRACQSRSNSLNAEQAAQVFFQFVPIEVQLNAQNVWLKCHESCKGNSARYVSLAAERAGEKLVTFTLRLDPAIPLAYVNSVVPENLSCSRPFTPASKIPATGLVSVCTILDLQKESLLVVVPSLGGPVNWIHSPGKPTPPPDSPRPSFVETSAPMAGNPFGCGGSMSCPSGQVLVGITDGTGCGIVNNGFCSPVNVRDQSGLVFGQASSSSCVALPQYGCGQSAECTGGRVLVAYSDGTGCGVPNGGTCCSLSTAGVELEPDINSCEWKSGFGCGQTSFCGPNQVMVGVKDGTSCNVQNQVKCCSLRPRRR